MKVLFLSQIVPFPPHGGVLQRGYNLLRELGRHAEVDLLAFVHPDELAGEDAVSNAHAALTTFCKSVRFFPLWPKQSPLHRFAALLAGVTSGSPFSVIAHRSQAFQNQLRLQMAAQRYDVVHVDTIALSQFVPPQCPVPLALTHHNIESQLMRRRSQVEQRPLARGILRRECAKLERYEAAVVPRFDLNILVSAADKAQLLARLPGLRTAVVPNGVDIEYFSPTQDDEAPALIYTGGMNMFANHDAVMHFVREIWPGIVSQRPGTRFVAVGQDPPADLRAAAARDPRIEVTGKVPDIRPLVHRAAVYVVPLRVGGGTRLKVLDAMALGKAIVSTTIGCEGIDVVAGRDLLVADDSDTFCASVIGLLDDSARRRALGRHARAVVEEKYAWPAIGQTLVDAYRSIALTQGRPR